MIFNYFKEEVPNMEVKISFDFNLAILINGQENFLIELIKCENEEVMNTKNLKLGKDQKIFYAECDTLGIGGFYYVLGNPIEN